MVEDLNSNGSPIERERTVWGPLKVKVKKKSVKIALKYILNYVWSICKIGRIDCSSSLREQNKNLSNNKVGYLASSGWGPSLENEYLHINIRQWGSAWFESVSLNLVQVQPLWFSCPIFRHRWACCLSLESKTSPFTRSKYSSVLNVGLRVGPLNMIGPSTPHLTVGT